MHRFIKPEEVGRWDGDTFVFDDPPYIVVTANGDPVTYERIRVDMAPKGEVTRDDVIHALINPVYAEPLEEQ